jgi:uncharacterized repeat protein (TIGR03803 family)
MTSEGGSSDRGTIFKINTDGTGFNVLHNFTGGSGDGEYPYSGFLALSGSTLYGMTQLGGSTNEGTVFKIDTDGSNFSLLLSLNSTTGTYPYDSVILSGSTLYGMASVDGSSGGGTLFQINTDGSGFSLLHEFSGGASDGRLPFGGLTLSGSTLYGTTFVGGSSDYGTVFSLVIPEPRISALLVAALGAFGLLRRRIVRC